MGIALLFKLSYYFNLMIQVLDNLKYSGFLILGFCHFCSFIPHRCFVFYTKYISSIIFDLLFLAKSLIYLFVLSKPSFQKVYPLSLAIIGLPIFNLCHLAITLTIQ